MFKNIIHKVFGDRRNPADIWCEDYIDEIERGGKVYRNLKNERVSVYRTFGGFYRLQKRHGIVIDIMTKDELYRALSQVYITARI